MRSEELFTEFVKFLNQIDLEIADFYLTETGLQKLGALVGKKNSKAFEVIGAHGSHSLICHWQIKKGISINDQPVVWLDSEGWPNSVFAPDFKSFVSLLPYDTGVLYDIVSAWLSHKEDPGSVPSPNEIYTKKDLKGWLASARERYGEYEKFLKWLEMEMHIPICDGPVNLIGKAMENNPDLSKWLNGEVLSF